MYQIWQRGGSKARECERGEEEVKYSTGWYFVNVTGVGLSSWGGWAKTIWAVVSWSCSHAPDPDIWNSVGKKKKEEDAAEEIEEE